MAQQRASDYSRNVFQMLFSCNNNRFYVIVVHLCKYIRMFTYITTKNVKRTIVSPLSGIHSASTPKFCCFFFE